MGIANQIKTTVLLASLTGLLLAAGLWFGGELGLIAAFSIAMLMNGISYFFSDKIVLKIYRAKEAEVSKYPRLHQIVNEIAEKAKLPKPKIYIIPAENSNAFATGRNPQHAAVAVTKGIMDLLTENELKGVLAHELAHVKNRDILIASVAATIAGAISFLAFMARWAAIFGGMRGGGRGRGMVELLVLAILTPILATIIRLAISRSREYLADKTGAEIIKDPKALASALAKLEEATKHKPMLFGNETTSHLFIVNPFRKSFLISIFSTHPPMKERIKRLEEMKF